jgi:hypothetical protein
MQPQISQITQMKGKQRECFPILICEICVICGSLFFASPRLCGEFVIPHLRNP